MVTNTLPHAPATSSLRAQPSAARAGILSILALSGVWVGMGLLVLGGLGVTLFVAAQAVMGIV